MKKALIVANLAGFASFLFNDMQILSEMGYAVTFAANANKLAWADTKARLEEMQVPFVQIDFDSKNPLSSKNRAAYKQIKVLLKEGGYDLIHCHTPIAGLITRLAAAKYRKKGTKVIYTTHGLSFTSYSSWKSKLIYRAIEKAGAKRSDAIITINHEDFEALKAMKACKNVFYIHGVGVDTQKYSNVDIDKSKYRADLGIPDDKIMILSVGELSVRKNHSIIIDALATLENKDEYIYVICGNGINGGTTDILTEKAKESGVNLLMLGFRFDIPEITACSDIGAIPSIREGLGLAGIQSLAAGVPLIGTAVQGIKDYIHDDVTGYLCAPFDVLGYAEAIKKLSTAEARNLMKENCISISKEFDKSISAAEMKQIYNIILLS